MFRQALVRREALFGTELQEAEPLLVEACAETKSPAASLDVLRDALTALIGLLERDGRAGEAGPWRERLQALTPTGR